MAISKENKKYLTDPNKILLEPLDIKFDITTLNSLISFIAKPSVLRTRKALTHIRKLFTVLNLSLYDNDKDPSCRERIWIIQAYLDGKLEDGISDDLLTQYVEDRPDCSEFAKAIIDEIEKKGKVISHDDSKYLIKKVDDILQYGYVTTASKIMKTMLESIEDGDFKSFKAVQGDLYDIATAIISIKRNNSSVGSDMTFSLDPDVFDNVVEEAMQKLMDRNRVYKTGIRMLNTILAPGYQSKRLYVYLALPGKGKSTVLLKSAIDIRKYNNIKPKDPDKRPAVLFLTLENDITETIERIYNMTVDSDDIRNYTVAQIKKKLREQGGLRLTSDNNVDIIIKEYRNREIDTDDLYTITNDLLDDGVEVIALIVDYLKRIRPAEKAKDEKEELKNITNELKEYAKFWDVPVISAQQLNRAGASVIDAALRADKEDVTRLVGRENIGSAWEIQENADFTCIINPEVKQDTNELYLTFKMLKRRYRSAESDENLRRKDYFNHPFAPGNEICLIDDIDMPKSISLDSLSSTKFKAAETAEEDDKDKKKKKKKIKYEDIEDYSPFSLDQVMNF